MKRFIKRLIGKCPDCGARISWFQVTCLLCKFDRWDRGIRYQAGIDD